jgi:hypothetical protein
MWISRDVHCPQHQVIPAARIANKERIVRTPPIDSVRTDSVCDEIMVRQDEMKQVIQTLVIKDINVANRLATARGF